MGHGTEGSEAGTARERGEKRPVRRGLGWFLVGVGVTFGVASLVHTGVSVPVGFATVRDPFPGAKVPEAVIGVVVLGGALVVLVRAAYARGVAIAAVVFAVIGTGAGLYFTLPSGRAGDIVYHLTVLAALLVALGLLVTPAGLRTGPRPGPASRPSRRTSGV